MARFFADEKAKLEVLEAKAEEAARAIEELDEEHGGEEGLLAEAKTEKGKLTAKSIKDRIRDVREDHEAAEELAMLKDCLALIEDEKAASDTLKSAQEALDEAVVKQYTKLTEEDAKRLIVNDKWLVRIADDVTAEVDRVSRALAGRLQTLTERYNVPLRRITTNADELAALVDAHLKSMGFAA